jgi:parallel beta-helix repeat protein
MRRTFALLTMLVVSIMCANCVNAVSTSVTLNPKKTLVVDKNSDDSYQSIMDAVNDANPGDTIKIQSGEYFEILNINKRVVLIGGEDAPLISPISKKNQYAIRLGAPGIELDNLRISNGAPGLYTSAIRIVKENIKIKNCEIFDTPVGIAIWTSNNVIDSCSFRGCQDEGIALLGSKNIRCNNNVIKNCLFYDNCDGIELQYSSNNQIINCRFYDNYHVGIDAIVSNNNANLISGCKIQDNKVYGIYISSSKDNLIINCELRDNQFGDIEIKGNSENNDVVSFSSQAQLRFRKNPLIDRIVNNFESSFVSNMFENNF